MAGIEEKSYIMIKPDGVQRGLVGRVLSRFEDQGFKLVGMKLLAAPKELLEVHYQDLKERPFFKDLVAYMSSGPVVAMVWQGKNVVARSRRLMGETDPQKSAPGTLRGDFCLDMNNNLIHGSDSVASAEREIALWFKPEELVPSYAKTMEKWIY